MNDMNGSNKQKSLFQAQLDANNDADMMQSPAERTADEPDVVEMMDEDEEDDDDEDDDDDDQEEYQSVTSNDHEAKHTPSHFLLEHHNNNNNSELLPHSRSISYDRHRHVSIDNNHASQLDVLSVNNEATMEPHDADALENEDRKRFQIELEFVQSLANPNYLNFLAQRGYFKSETFINYLKYLMYWKKPEYCKYLMYPQCLSLLEMLQHEKFLKEIVNAACSKYIDEQILLIWLHYKTRRDWIRIDPCQLPQNIEKLFRDGDVSLADDDDDDNDGHRKQNEENTSSVKLKKSANHHHFHENHLRGGDPFLASLFIANEKF